MRKFGGFFPEPKRKMQRKQKRDGDKVFRKGNIQAETPGDKICTPKFIEDETTT
jgi:hypothetical protein